MEEAKKRKGIILAGGTGSRLLPLTLFTSKQLLPVFDKPMIYYPLAILMLAGIKEILIISTPRDLPMFKQLLGNGNKWGVEFSYLEQKSPKGIAQAFLIGEEFIGDDHISLILGDNIFYAEGLRTLFSRISRKTTGATVFGYYVNNPEEYGVVTLDEDGAPETIEEKPSNPKSNYAITGLYFYDNDVVQIAKTLKPSNRGELEITDINRAYLSAGKLDVELFSRGTTWLDTGDHGRLLDAANFVRIIEERQGLKIACPEEIAYKMGFISSDQLENVISKLKKSSYREYLEKIIERPSF